MLDSSLKFQYLAALVVNMLTIGYGVSCGWSSPNVIILTSDDSPLPSGKIMMSEASWIASLLCIGGLTGNIFFGFVTNAFGRKIPLILITIPAMAGWLLILYAQNVYYLYAARIVNGFVGGGIFCIVPLFLNEIANDSVRGVLGSTMCLSVNFGILIGFTIGGYCDYDMTPKLAVGLTILCAASLFFFPESPKFLLKQGNVTAAEESIHFYQNMSGRKSHSKVYKYKLIQIEVEKLRKSIEGPITDKVKNSSFAWSDLFSGPGRKAMIIGIVLAAINQLCGCFAMMNYTASILQESGSAMPSKTSAIIVGIIQVIGSISATFLVERAGRKILFLISSIRTALGLITLGGYFMFKSWGYNIEAFNWIPIVSLSWIIFIASWAILSLTFLVISEVMPEKIKEFGLSLCVSLIWGLAFLMVKLLPVLINLLGFHGIMFLFAGCCLSCALFIILYVPEAAGKSYEQIMDLL